jgi:hypothetical protein
MELRLAEPHELHVVPCHARRGGPRSRVRCTMPALHDNHFHAARGRDGRWFIWNAEVPLTRP